MGKQTSRQLKVYGLNRSASNKEVPELRLAGMWVEQLGFKVGDWINITTRDKLLIIEPVEAEAQEKIDYKVALKEVKQTLKKLSQ